MGLGPWGCLVELCQNKWYSDLQTTGTNTESKQFPAFSLFCLSMSLVAASKQSSPYLAEMFASFNHFKCVLFLVREHGWLCWAATGVSLIWTAHQGGGAVREEEYGSAQTWQPSMPPLDFRWLFINLLFASVPLLNKGGYVLMPTAAVLSYITKHICLSLPSKGIISENTRPCSRSSCEKLK